MAFGALASSFPATAALLCGLFYADYALTIWGQRLYMAKGREFQEHEAYELNPMWRETIAESRWWSWRLWRGFLPMMALAASLWYLGWLGGEVGRLGLGDPLGFMSHAPLAIRDTFLAIVISRSLILIGMHVRNIVLYSRYLGPDYVSGKTAFNAAYSFGVSRVNCLTAAIPFAVLAALQPTPLTIGFALGPLVLALNLARMESRSRRPGVEAAKSATEER